jgi:hypothetical protein
MLPALFKPAGFGLLGIRQEGQDNRHAGFYEIGIALDRHLGDKNNGKRFPILPFIRGRVPGVANCRKLSVPSITVNMSTMMCSRLMPLSPLRWGWILLELGKNRLRGRFLVYCLSRKSNEESINASYISYPLNKLSGKPIPLEAIARR